MRHLLWVLAGLCALPASSTAQTVTGVEPGGNQYSLFQPTDEPSVSWRGWNAARTRMEFFVQVGLKPHPEYRRYPLKLTFSIDTLSVTFDTREFGEHFFDPVMIPYSFAKSGRYTAVITEWYLMPNKEWEKVIRTRVIVPIRPLL